MNWLPKFFKSVSPATCFLCTDNITDGGADIKYAYDNNGKKALSRVLICTKCANDLEITTSDLKKE